MGNANVRIDRRGMRLGETKVRPTHSHNSNMVQRLAPRKRLMDMRFRNVFIKNFRFFEVLKDFYFLLISNSRFFSSGVRPS